MDKVAIIGSGKMACAYIDKAYEMGIDTLCFAQEASDVMQHPIGKFYEVDIFDVKRIIDICREEGVRGVLPTTELTISVAGRVAFALNLTSNSIAIMDNITKKQWVRDKIKNAKYMKQLWYRHIVSKDEDQRNCEFPVIVKPVSEGGKRGITVAENSLELKKALDDAFFYDKHGNGVIIEQFLTSGREFSVEGLSYHGQHQIIQVTDNISSGSPHCVELGHSQPADITIELRNRIIEAVCELLTMVRFENGGTHTEIKIYKDEIYLIELNARLGGDCIAYPMTELSTGYDYLAENINVCMGIKPKDRGIIPGIGYSGIRFITKQTADLKTIFDTCDNKPWLYEKKEVTDTFEERTGNQDVNNYFIYVSEKRVDF